MVKTNLLQKNIPKGWHSVKVSSLGSAYSGLRGKSKNDFGHGTPYITYMNIFGNSKIDINKFDLVEVKEGENQSKVKYGDIFFTVSSETPKEVGMCSVLLDKIDNFYLNSFCFGFRLNDFNSLLPQYARFLFRGPDFRFKIIKMAQGSTRFNLSQERVLSLDVLLPTIKEQHKLAEILGAVDEDIARTQGIIKTTEKLKVGLMQQLFTHGIGHTKFKETKIGQIPEAWSVVQVSEVVKKVVDNRGKTPALASEGVGMIEVNAIDSSQKYPNYSKISKYVSQETYNTWFRNGHPETGDVLIPTVGTVGVAVLMNENKGCIAQNIIAIRVKDAILPDFFYYLVISPLFVDQIRKVLMGAVQPSLKVPHMLAFNIPLPSKSEQKEISEILSAVDEKISVNKKLKEKLIQLKKGLMSDLLSGNVRVN